MTETPLTELLQEWTELEDDRCILREEAVTLCIDDAWQSYPLDPVPEGALEQTLRQAIAYHSWLCRTSDSTGVYEARIETAADEPLAAGISSRSYCQALLKAYLGALRTRSGSFLESMEGRLPI